MVKITGAKAHAARMRFLAGPEMVNEVGRALFAAGNLIEVDAALSITEGSVSGKNHVASKPGEPPNADTNQLDRGIITVQTSKTTVEVQSNAPHSDDMEFGNSKVAERPYMRPAVARKRKEATALVRNHVNAVIRKSKRS